MKEETSRYKMVILFNKDDLKSMNRGQIARWSAGAAMWLLDILNNDCDASVNGYGNGINSHPKLEKIIVNNWVANDAYRTIVLQTDTPLLEMFEKLKNANVPVYLQRSAHEQITTTKQGDAEHHTIVTHQFKPMALACFISQEQAGKLELNRLELLK